MGRLRHWICVVLSSVFILSNIVACTPTDEGQQESNGGCSNNDDCRGGRTCVGGECVWSDDGHTDTVDSVDTPIDAQSVHDVVDQPELQGTHDIITEENDGTADNVVERDMGPDCSADGHCNTECASDPDCGSSWSQSSCESSGGYWASDGLGDQGCWFYDEDGDASCTDVCESQGLDCVEENWNDDADCSILQHFDPYCNCLGQSNPVSWYPQTESGFGRQCHARSNDGEQDCDEDSFDGTNVGNYHRICVCEP